MVSSLCDYDPDNADVVYFSDAFRNVVEQNLEYIKNATTNENGLLSYGTIPDGEAVACHGDFRKVMVFLKIPPHLAWIVLRVNGYLGYNEYTKDKREIIIPDFSLIYKLQLSNAVTQTNI